METQLEYRPSFCGPFALGISSAFFAVAVGFVPLASAVSNQDTQSRRVVASRQPSRRSSSAPSNFSSGWQLTAAHGPLVATLARLNTAVYPGFRRTKRGWKPHGTARGARQVEADVKTLDALLGRMDATSTVDKTHMLHQVAPYVAWRVARVFEDAAALGRPVDVLQAIHGAWRSLLERAPMGQLDADRVDLGAAEALSGCDGVPEVVEAPPTWIVRVLARYAKGRAPLAPSEDPATLLRDGITLSAELGRSDLEALTQQYSYFVTTARGTSPQQARAEAQAATEVGVHRRAAADTVNQVTNDLARAHSAKRRAMPLAEMAQKVRKAVMHADSLGIDPSRIRLGHSQSFAVVATLALHEALTTALGTPFWSPQQRRQRVVDDVQAIFEMCLTLKDKGRLTRVSSLAVAGGHAQALVEAADTYRSLGGHDGDNDWARFAQLVTEVERPSKVPPMPSKTAAAAPYLQPPPTE